MGEVAEAEGDASQVLEAAIDGFDGLVGGAAAVEECRGLAAFGPQGAAELGQFVQPAGAPCAAGVWMTVVISFLPAEELVCW